MSPASDVCLLRGEADICLITRPLLRLQLGLRYIYVRGDAGLFLLAGDFNEVLRLSQ